MGGLSNSMPVVPFKRFWQLTGREFDRFIIYGAVIYTKYH